MKRHAIYIALKEVLSLNPIVCRRGGSIWPPPVYKGL